MLGIKIHFALIVLAVVLFRSPWLPISIAIAEDKVDKEVVASIPVPDSLLAAEQMNPPQNESAVKKPLYLHEKNKTETARFSVDQYELLDLKNPIDTIGNDTERDIMEEAVALLNESQTYWVNGQLDEALEILDQAYALLLETNGYPDSVRQKDDLRLMISRKILSIYNSNQDLPQGKRSEIPLTVNADVEKEIRKFQTVERDFFISSYQRSIMYRPIILNQLKKAGLPEELSWLPLVESGFKINALSTARALGLWQFIPSTGYKYGLNRDDWVDERMDFKKSTGAAISYLKDLHNMFGDWLTVLAAYNCGEGRVMRTIASQHINYLDRFWDLYQRLPYETARYVPRFLATLQIISNPQKYGMDLVLTIGNESILSYETVEINKSMRLSDIAQHIGAAEEILQILNAELRHRVTPDRPYKLRVPIELSGKLLSNIDTIAEAKKPDTVLVLAGRSMVTHTVRQGETLNSLAKKYKTTVAAIRAVNKLSARQMIAAGQRLNVPIQSARGADPARPQKMANPVRHSVQKGETLTSIAMKYDMSIGDIRNSNQLRDDALKIGQMLLIPNSRSGAVKTSEKKYIVQKGDNLSQIAAQNNISLERLLELNDLALKERILPGQVIFIP
jgi:membrane-bound lytic murein transglycosylase D